MTATTERNETTQEVQRIPFSQILSAIATGVEARLTRTVVANMVTVETICVARKLHIPEDEIQEWRSSRCYRSEPGEQPGCPSLQGVGERK